MSDVFTFRHVGPSPSPRPRKPSVKAWGVAVAVLSLVAAVVLVGPRLLATPAGSTAAAPPPPSVAVSMPVQRDVNTRLQFVGQFSAMNMVEVRAQVGGTLTQLGFTDGDIVHQGDLH
jgi:multidrug efflux pump subunit AcrA (membrane-fusion protein)